jgi:hypothetical protein
MPLNEFDVQKSIEIEDMKLAAAALSLKQEAILEKQIDFVKLAQSHKTTEQKSLEALERSEATLQSIDRNLAHLFIVIQEQHQELVKLGLKQQTDVVSAVSTPTEAAAATKMFVGKARGKR